MVAMLRTYRHPTPGEKQTLHPAMYPTPSAAERHGSAGLGIPERPLGVREIRGFGKIRQNL